MAIKFRSGDRDRLYNFAKENVKPDPALAQAYKDAVEELTAHMEEATKAHYGADLDALKRHDAVSGVSMHWRYTLPLDVRQALDVARGRLNYVAEVETARPIYHHCQYGLKNIPGFEPDPFVAALEARAKMFRDLEQRINSYVLFVRSARNWDEVLAVWPAAGKVMGAHPAHPVPSPITQSVLDMIKADNAGA